MANRLGIVIPAGLSIVFFDEVPSAVQATGILCALLSIIYIGLGNEDGSLNLKRSTTSDANADGQSASYLLVILFLVGGSIDFMSKLIDESAINIYKDQYVFISYIVAALVCVLLMIGIDDRIFLIDILIGAIIGIPNTFTLIFTLRAVSVLPAYLVFPVAGAGAILGVLFINAVILHERLTRKDKISAVIVAGSIVLLNL